MRIRMRWHALCGERMVMIFALHAGPEDASSMDENFASLEDDDR